MFHVLLGNLDKPLQECSVDITASPPYSPMRSLLLVLVRFPLCQWHFPHRDPGGGNIHVSGQMIATSKKPHPKWCFGKEIPLFQGYLGW